MKQLKNSLILALTFITMLTSCEKDEENTNIANTDNLEQIGIISQWKLDSRDINGISSLAVECCDYIDFEMDSDPNDWSGLFNAFGTGYNTNGVFELDTSDETIDFSNNDDQRLYNIQISETRIEFNYMDNSDSIVEHWLKEE